MTRNAYYNENDPKAAEWLRQLIARNLIAPGDVDERSIEDVLPADLTRYRQCHFFAGIGGWSYALRLAGWPDDRPVWTGSCPCQPFSQAGAGKGFDDPRHLWPCWRWLIDQRRPAKLFGEQVASPSGREWFARVRADLEAMGYSSGAADLCAAGVGAPQIRQRLFWLGEPNSGGWSPRKQASAPMGQRHTSESASSTGRLASGGCKRIETRVPEPQQGKEGFPEKPNHGCDRGDPWSPWAWIPCEQGKFRRIRPGIQLLAHGIPGRVSLLRGFGNAIIPQLAAEFVMAAVDAKRQAATA